MKLIKHLAITLVTTIICCSLWVLATWLAPQPFGYGEPSLPLLPTAIPKYEGPTEKPTFAYPLIEVGDHVRVRSETQRYDAELTVRNGYMLGSFLVEVETKTDIEKRLDPWTLRRSVSPPPGPSLVGSSRVLPMWGDAQLVLGEVVQHPDVPAKSVKEVEKLVSAVLQKTQQNKFLRPEGLLIATNRPLDDPALRTVIETARSHGVVDFEFLVESGSEPAVLRYSDAPDPCALVPQRDRFVVECNYRPSCYVRPKKSQTIGAFQQALKRHQGEGLSPLLAFESSEFPSCDDYQTPTVPKYVAPSCRESDVFCVTNIGQLPTTQHETLEQDCRKGNPLACAGLASTKGQPKCDQIKSPDFEACLRGDAAQCWAVSLEKARAMKRPPLEGQVIEWKNPILPREDCASGSVPACMSKARDHILGGRRICGIAAAYETCRLNERYCPWFVHILWSTAEAAR